MWHKEGYDVPDKYYYKQVKTSKMQNRTETKVKAVQGAGTWDSPHGLLYKFEYTMDDGETLTAMHKQNKPFDVGSDVEYEITGENEHGKRGKVKKPSDGNTSSNINYSNARNDDYVKGIEVGHACNNAVNLICAGIDLIPETQFNTPEEKIKAYAIKIMEIATDLKQS